MIEFNANGLNRKRTSKEKCIRTMAVSSAVYKILNNAKKSFKNEGLSTTLRELADKAIIATYGGSQ